MQFRLRTLFQFRLGTLLLAVTLLGIWLGARGNIARRQQQGVLEIQKLGGWVHYDFELDSAQNSIPGARSWVPQRIVAVTGLDLFHDVVDVNMCFDLSGSGIVNNPRTDFDITKQIENFPRLRQLILKGTPASDACLAAAARLPYLEKVCCIDAEVTDAGTAHLRQLRRLTNIVITRSKITDESLRVIGQMPQLERLSFRENHLTDRGLGYLCNLKRLKHLNVDLCSTEITDSGLAELEGLQSLEILLADRMPWLANHASVRFRSCSNRPVMISGTLNLRGR